MSEEYFPVMVSMEHESLQKGFGNRVPVELWMSKYRKRDTSGIRHKQFSLIILLSFHPARSHINEHSRASIKLALQIKQFHALIFLARNRRLLSIMSSIVRFRASRKTRCKLLSATWKEKSNRVESSRLHNSTKREPGGQVNSSQWLTRRLPKRTSRVGFSLSLSLSVLATRVVFSSTSRFHRISLSLSFPLPLPVPRDEAVVVQGRKMIPEIAVKWYKAGDKGDRGGHRLSRQSNTRYPVLDR